MIDLLIKLVNKVCVNVLYYAKPECVFGHVC